MEYPSTVSPSRTMRLLITASRWEESLDHAMACNNNCESVMRGKVYCLLGAAEFFLFWARDLEEFVCFTGTFGEAVKPED